MSEQLPATADSNQQEPESLETTTRQELYAYINELAARASGRQPKEPYHPAEPDRSDYQKMQTLLERAGEHVRMGIPLPVKTRLRLFKRVARRLARLFFYEQEIFNRSIVAALQLLYEEKRSLPARIAGAQAALASLELTNEELRDEIADARSQLDLLRRQLTETKEKPDPIS